MIQVERITKRFRRRRLLRRGPAAETVALAGVSFTVEPGEVFGLIGPNGAGKTTLMKVLATLILPTSGKAQVQGYDVVAQAPQARRAVALVTGSERSFYYRLTGWQNLEFFGALRGLRGRELHRRMQAVLEQVGLTEAAHRRYMEYSAGMKKRLDLARALLVDPPVYLLDEPTSAVDPACAAHLREIIVGLKARGRTVLLTSHDLDEVERVADRVGLLHRGRLLAVAPVETLKAQLGWASVQVRLAGPLNGQIRHLEALSAVQAVQVDEARRTVVLRVQEPQVALNQVIQVLAHRQIPVVDLQVVRPSLEEVFIELTGGESRV